MKFPNCKYEVSDFIPGIKFFDLWWSVHSHKQCLHEYTHICHHTLSLPKYMDRLSSEINASFRIIN